MSPDLFIELRNGAIFYLILALSVTLHEFGHAKAADLVGDPLPRRQGRVTLNPLAHLDMFGTVLIPLTMIFVPIFLHGGMGFMLIGWGRPVQISLPHRETRRRDEILITIAGPIMNALIALVVAVAIGLIARSNSDFANAVVPFGVQAIVLNACLIAFNLIPLPPLDGSRILRHMVGMSDEAFRMLARNSLIILLVLVNLPAFQHLLNLVTNIIASPFIGLAERLAG